MTKPARTMGNDSSTPRQTDNKGRACATPTPTPTPTPMPQRQNSDPERENREQERIREYNRLKADNDAKRLREEQESKRRAERFIKRPQVDRLVQGLVDTMENDKTGDIVEIVTMVKEKVYPFDPATTLRGTIANHVKNLNYSVGEFCRRILKLDVSEYILFDSKDRERILVDGVKPYLLAFLYMLYDQSEMNLTVKWATVFERLADISECSLYDQIFGVPLATLIVRGLTPTTTVADSEYIRAYFKYTDTFFRYNEAFMRRVFKGFSVADVRRLEYDPLDAILDNLKCWRRDSFLRDFLAVADCESLFSERDYFLAVEEKGAEHNVGTLELFMGRGHKFPGRTTADGKDNCFTLAIKRDRYADVRFYLQHFDIFKKFQEYRILHYLLAHVIDAEMVRLAISRATTAGVDLVSVRSPQGRTPLQLLLDNLAPDAYAKYATVYDAVIGTLISHGADVDDQKLLDTLSFEKRLFHLVRKIADFRREYLSRVTASDAGKAPAPDAGKTPASDAGKAPASDVGKAPAPDAGKAPG